jgi:hypothetical protein
LLDPHVAAADVFSAISWTVSPTMSVAVSGETMMSGGGSVVQAANPIPRSTAGIARRSDEDLGSIAASR